MAWRRTSVIPVLTGVAAVLRKALVALTGGAVCCHLRTASGAPSDDRIAAVMVLCA